MAKRQMIRSRSGTIRLGLLKISLGGVGCLGMLLIFLALYVVSVAWWSMWLMLAVHWANAANWSFLWTATHWGLLCPLVLG